jgi:hypothetical protein
MVEALPTEKRKALTPPAAERPAAGVTEPDQWELL